MNTTIYYAITQVVKSNDETGFNNYDGQFKLSNPELKATIIKSRNIIIEQSKQALMHSSTDAELAVALAEAMFYVAYDIIRFNSKETCDSLAIFDSKLIKLSVQEYKTHEIAGHQVLNTLHFNNYDCTSMLNSLNLFMILEDSLSKIHPNTQELFDCVVESSKKAYDIQDEIMLNLVTQKLNETK